MSPGILRGVLACLSTTVSAVPYSEYWLPFYVRVKMAATLLGFLSKCDQGRSREKKEVSFLMCLLLSVKKPISLSQKSAKRYPSYYLGQNHVKGPCLTRVLARGNGHHEWIR